MTCIGKWTDRGARRRMNLCLPGESDAWAWNLCQGVLSEGYLGKHGYFNVSLFLHLGENKIVTLNGSSLILVNMGQLLRFHCRGTRHSQIRGEMRNLLGSEHAMSCPTMLTKHHSQMIASSRDSFTNINIPPALQSWLQAHPLEGKESVMVTPLHCNISFH